MEFGKNELPAVRMAAAATIALAAVESVVAIGIGAAGGTEGTQGGMYFGLLFALPLVVVGIALSRPSPRLHAGAAAAAALLAVAYVLILVGNWSGYTAAQRVVAPLLLIPAVIDYLAVLAVVFVEARRRTPRRLER